MSTDRPSSAKLPGKTLYAGRRRVTTRSSGFEAHKDTTGGEFRRHFESVIPLKKGEAIVVTFVISNHKCGDLVGYGAWFWCTKGIVTELYGGTEKKTLTAYGDDSWNKVGSIWTAQDASQIKITFKLTATDEVNRTGFYGGHFV